MGEDSGDRRSEDPVSIRSSIQKLIRLVGRCLTRLCSYEDPMDGIADILKILGDASGVTSTFFFSCRETDEGVRISHRYTWTGSQEHLLTDSPDFQDTDPSEVGFGFLREFEPGPRILSAEDPDVSPEARSVLEKYDVPSVLMFPVLVNGETRGLIGIASTTPSRSWHEEEVSLLGMIAGCLGSGLEKKIPIISLQKSEKKYRELFSLLRLLADNMPDMLWAKDMQKRYIFANRSICENLLNASGTEEPIGRTDMFFAEREREAHPDDPQWHTFGELCMDSDRIVMESRRSHRFDEYGNIQGRYLHLDVHKAPIINEEGEMIGTVGSAREVTREKELERDREDFLEALQDSERNLRDSHRMAGMGSWSYEPATDSMVLSEEAKDLLELDHDPSGEEVFNIILHERDRETFDRIVEEALASGTTEVDWEHRVVKPNGRTLWVHSRMRIEYDDDGTPSKFFGVSQDITWRRRLEEEKLRLERRILHAQKLESLGILAGGIAHDFNNILMGILGNADLALRDIPESSPAYERVKGVIDNSNVASELSNQMLAYSGRGSFKIEPLNLSDTVRSMRQLLTTSISKNVTLKSDLTDKDTGMMGDSTQVRQIVMNLVLNASESYGNGNGTITLKTGRLECDDDCLASTHPSVWQHLDEPPPPGEYVYLQVTDSGCGMDEKTLERIFEPFFSTKFSGRGLGLAAVMGIVRSHGGLVSIESAPGKGSSFRVMFPAGGTGSADQPGAAGVEMVPQGGTVLIVDDEPSVRNVVSRMLEKAGFRVVTAATGQEALDLYSTEAEGIDCVLLDLTMPRMSGTKCLEELRKLNPNIKVVISSGFTREDVIRRFTGQEITGFIQKPYRYDDLMRVISNTLKDT